MMKRQKKRRIVQLNEPQLEEEEEDRVQHKETME
jgi:hypothetical protein